MKNNNHDVTSISMISTVFRFHFHKLMEKVSRYVSIFTQVTNLAWESLIMKLVLRFRADYNERPSLWFPQCLSVRITFRESFGETLIKNLSTMRR